MAITIAVSQKELERQAAAVFEGKGYEVFLGTKGALTPESLVTDWKATSPTGNGYAAVTGTVGTGSYNVPNGRYQLPDITATFTASAAGFSYDTVCVVIDGATHLYGTITESPSITLTAGSSKTYTITLAQDD